MRLSLRMMFWLVLVAAVVVGWAIEHVRLATKLAEVKQKASSATYLQWGVTLLRNRKLQSLRTLSDEEILQRFEQWGEKSQPYNDDMYQGCLSEMLRRGMHTPLREHYDQLRSEAQKHPQEGTSGLKVPAHGTMLLPFVAAVRRAEGQPDPVRIQLSYQPAPTASSPPLIVPALENVDIDKQELYLRTQGDYGTRRDGGWQIRLRDELGHLMPQANKVEATGGYGGFKSLPFGGQEVCDRALDVRSYVKQPPPGRYKLQVLFNTEDIGSDPDLTGLIVFQSAPVEVIVSHQIPREGRAAIPLLILLYAALLGTVAAIIVQRCRRDKASRPPLVTWRDALAWAVLIALLLAWLSDVRHLGEQIRPLQFDEDAAWTWRVAE